MTLQFYRYLQLLAVLLLSVLLQPCCTEPVQNHTDDPSAKRIISLAPSLTEWIFMLKADGDLKARTDRCDRPPGAVKLPSVGSLFPPQLEKILSHKPTDVFMISGHEDLKAQLKRFQINVHTLQPKSMKDIFNHVEFLGDLLGRKKEAQDWLILAQKRIKHMVRPSRPVRVLVEIWASPLTVAGAESYIGDLVRVAGGQAIPSGQGDWPTPSMEHILVEDPEIIFVSSDQLFKTLTSAEPPKPWSALSAVKNGHVVKLDGRLARPGPRVIDELLWLNRQLLLVTPTRDDVAPKPASLHDE